MRTSSHHQPEAQPPILPTNHEPPADYPISVNDKRVSGRLQDAKTEIGKSRPETGRRNSRFSARKWELVGARDGVVRANARNVGTFPQSLPTRQNNRTVWLGSKDFEPGNGELGLNPVVSAQIHPFNVGVGMASFPWRGAIVTATLLRRHLTHLVLGHFRTLSALRYAPGTQPMALSGDHGYR